MFLATSNRTRQLLLLSYAQRVRPEDLERARKDVKMLVADLPTGFRLLADLSQLESMDLDCMKEIGRAMELFDRSGVGMIVRVIPDPGKDIGLNILAIFHYPQHPRTITCQNLADALHQLSLWG